MSRTTLIVHERLAHWARQLRPRVATWPVRLVETRSASDLGRVWQGAAYPMVVADLDRWPSRGLADLVRARPIASEALVLVLDPGRNPGVPRLAREVGATQVFSGVVTPPMVFALLERWLGIAQQRAALLGWTGDPEPELGLEELFCPSTSMAVTR